MKNMTVILLLLISLIFISSPKKNHMNYHQNNKIAVDGTDTSHNMEKPI